MGRGKGKYNKEYPKLSQECRKNLQLLRMGQKNDPTHLRGRHKRIFEKRYESQNVSQPYVYQKHHIQETRGGILKML